MIYSIENDLLLVKIQSIGAELQNLILKSDHTEYLWQADKRYWGRHAPLCFPIIGRLKVSA